MSFLLLLGDPETVASQAEAVIESVTSVMSVASGQFEALELSMIDAGIPTEAAFTISGEIALAVESGLGISGDDAAAAVEATGLALEPGAGPIESRAFVQSVGLTAFEHHSEQVDQTQEIKIEASSWVSSDIVSAAPIGWESKRLLIIAGGTTAEAAMALVAQLASPAEWLVTSVPDGSAVFEALQALSGGGQETLEYTLGVLAAGQDTVESLIRVRGPSAVLVEATSLIDTVTEVAQTGPVEVEALRRLPVAAEMPFEAKRLLLITARAPAEAKSYPISEGAQVAESARRLALTAQVALESNAASDSAAGELPWEGLRKLLVPGAIPWSHSDADQPPDHTRISGRAVLIIRRDLQAVLIVARGSSGG